MKRLSLLVDILEGVAVGAVAALLITGTLILAEVLR